MAFQPLFNYPNNKLYQYEAYPVKLYCNFVVDSTNGNGLGIRSLKGAGIANVFMHTSATPAAGNYGVTNPNPASGLVLVQFQNNFSQLLDVTGGFVSPLTGSNLTSVTAGNAYVLTGLGTATAAQLQAVGCPAGFTPALGMAFIASASVAMPASGTTSIETIGDTNQAISNANIYQNGGCQLILQTLGPTISAGAYVAPLIPTAPADGSVLALTFTFSNSSVKVAGQ
jgi:hypothetical protein